MVTVQVSACAYECDIYFTSEHRSPYRKHPTRSKLQLKPKIESEPSHTRRQNMAHNLQQAAPAQFEDLFFNRNFMDMEDNEGLDDDNMDNVPDMGAVNQENNNTDPICWVFGYGSLCWFPGFNYSKCITGYIRGYVRRFWQGNTTHRGTEEKPGRVATLVQDSRGITWGCAYQVTGTTALDYLKQRECTLGGYVTIETKFFPRVASYDTPFSGEAVPVLVYIATPDNRHWLGEQTAHQIANEIAECRGPSGHNAEYLLRLAKFMHEEIPDVIDEHLFELEYLVLEELHKRQIPLWTVMGANPERIRRDSHENIRRPPSFEFTARVPERKLRCLNI